MEYSYSKGLSMVKCPRTIDAIKLHNRYIDPKALEMRIKSLTSVSLLIAAALSLLLSIM